MNAPERVDVATRTGVDARPDPAPFGFPIMLHPRDPDVALVIPEEGAENRVTSNARLGVYRTRDGGASWELAAKGLPEQAFRMKGAIEEVIGNSGVVLQGDRRGMSEPLRHGCNPALHTGQVPMFVALVVTIT